MLSKNKKNKTLAVTGILIIYLVAISISVGVTLSINIQNPILFVFVSDIIATLIVFFFSLLFKNSSIYDPYWSVIPILVVVYLILLNPQGNSIRQSIIFLLVFYWSFRLTINWVRGWSGFKHEDWRYTKLAADYGKFYWPISFLGIHLFPTLLVFLGCLPLFYILPNSNPISFIEYLAAAISFGAISFEWIADEQLKKFKKNTSNASYMDKGLWGISRHPNYLGEILFWFGIFLFVTALGFEKAHLLSVSGFIAMILLFRFISIPMMEKRNLSNRKGYSEYIKRVPALLPLKFLKSN